MGLKNAGVWRPAWLVALLLAGCQTLDPDWQREASAAIRGGGLTAVHELFPGVAKSAAGEIADRQQRQENDPVEIVDPGHYSRITAVP